MSQPSFDFRDEPYDDPANPTYTVGELADAINQQLRRGFDDGVWVRGEIDGLRNSGPTPTSRSSRTVTTGGRCSTSRCSRR